MRREAAHRPLFPDSSSLRAAGGWQRENTHWGVWLQKAAAALPLKYLTRALSSFPAAQTCSFSSFSSFINKESMQLLYELLDTCKTVSVYGFKEK